MHQPIAIRVSMERLLERIDDLVRFDRTRYREGRRATLYVYRLLLCAKSKYKFRTRLVTGPMGHSRSSMRRAGTILP
jgi:hypothetical protein